MTANIQYVVQQTLSSALISELSEHETSRSLVEAVSVYTGVPPERIEANVEWVGLDKCNVAIRVDLHYGVEYGAPKLSVIR